MSFLGTAFSGASNNFTPGGTQALPGQAQQANQNYAQANQGLNDLATMLKAQASGTGPNLANQQLQRATAQNTANQAALQAGQRGAGANVGLMARQIGQQGANLQQQMAGQSAENVLAQQLAAQQQLAGVYGQQGQMANQNFGISQGGIQHGNELGANIAGQNAKMNQGIIGGIAQGGASAIGLAEGGELDTGFKDSGFSNSFLVGKKPGIPMGAMMAHGGLPFSPMDYTSGGEIQAQAPEQKATVQGNSYSNDKIPGMLSEGEVVLPREVTQHPNAPQMAAQFMSQVMAGKHRAKK